MFSTAHNPNITQDTKQPRISLCLPHYSPPRVDDLLYEDSTGPLARIPYDGRAKCEARQDSDSRNVKGQGAIRGKGNVYWHRHEARPQCQMPLTGHSGGNPHKDKIQFFMHHRKATVCCGKISTEATCPSHSSAEAMESGDRKVVESLSW
ncbi:hypothetical protein BaRGS_00019916 [Batillaria attramentaria]|uniref:Uncharacterized protein n=1 Tax=Batillaria attramentaria TaxID=370345 RepID=A0ABD0KPF0_9CAEN